MKEQIKEKYIEALRDGKYEWSKGVHLRSDSNKYNFLGVLADLYIKETKRDKWLKTKFGYYILDDSGRVTDLPSDIVKWAEINEWAASDYLLTNNTVEPPVTTKFQGLVLMPFKDIAELIKNI